MSYSKRVKLERARPLLIAVVATVAVVTLLLVAKPSQGAWGGNNKPEDRGFFKWIYVLFRNPADEHKWPLDGYQTGYMLELEPDVFLINNNALARASINGQLMGARPARDLPFIDPSKSEWPQRGLGNISLLASVGWDFGVYKVAWRIRPNIGTTSRPRSRQSRQDIKTIDPSRESFPYAIWNEDKNLVTNCYMYSFSVPDYRDADRGAEELGMPPNIYAVKEDKFYENETRIFSRWPVKLAEPCNNSGCRFIFDSLRYLEEDKKDRYTVKRARACAGWQDVGAPIMCGDEPPWHKGYNVQGVYYERQYLKLSYVVRKAGQHSKNDWKHDPNQHWTNQCWDSVIAKRLSDYAEDVKKVLK